MFIINNPISYDDILLTGPKINSSIFILSNKYYFY